MADTDVTARRLNVSEWPQVWVSDLRTALGGSANACEETLVPLALAARIAARSRAEKPPSPRCQRAGLSTGQCPQAVGAKVRGRGEGEGEWAGERNKGACGR